MVFQGEIGSGRAYRDISGLRHGRLRRANWREHLQMIEQATLVGVSLLVVVYHIRKDLSADVNSDCSYPMWTRAQIWFDTNPAVAPLLGFIFYAAFRMK